MRGLLCLIFVFYFHFGVSQVIKIEDLQTGNPIKGALVTINESLSDSMTINDNSEKIFKNIVSAIFVTNIHFIIISILGMGMGPGRWTGDRGWIPGNMS